MSNITIIHTRSSLAVLPGIDRFWAGFLLAMIVALPVQAQTKNRAEAQTALEEVIVSARKRDENIQETPIAVSAFSGDALREQGIVNAEDLSKSVPSLQIVGGDSVQIYIRGVGQRGGGSRADPAVSVYLDGIFIPRADGTLLDTVDIESVQVLRGPQGTLFGKNNNGGALVFNLVKPSEVVEGYVDATMGNFNEQILKAAVNIPHSENFASRIAINLNRRDGTVREMGDGKKYNENDTQSIALQSRWDVSDSLALSALLFYNKVDGTLIPNNCRANNPGALLVSSFGLLYHGDTDPGNPQAYADACEANSQDVLPEYTTYAGPFEGKKKLSESLTAGFSASWELSATSQLKLMAAYRGEVVGAGKARGDNDGGRHDISEGMVRDDSDRHSYTLELQYNASFFDDAVDLTAGFFGQIESASDRDFALNSYAGLTGGSAGAAATGLDPGVLLDLANTVDQQPLLFPALGGPNILSDFDFTGETVGVFSQVTWHINEQWELTAGGRFTEESRDSDARLVHSDLPATEALITGLNPLFQSTQIPGFMTYTGPGGWLDDPVGLINAVLPDTDGNGYYNTPMNYAGAATSEGTVRFSEFTPMVSASWFMPDAWLDDSFLDSTMVYMTWSNGFKSGFMEPSGADGLALVEPETLENTEIGFKLDAFERTVRLNVALYDMSFENMQLIQVTGDSAGALVVRFKNAGKSKITGGEMELSWLPAPGWLISFSYSNNNYKFEEFLDQDIFQKLAGNDTFNDRSDENFPVSPEQSAALGVQYALQTEYGVFVPRIDVSYKGQIYLGFDNGSWDSFRRDEKLASADAYSLVDLRLAWKHPEENLTVTAFVKNALAEVFTIGTVSVADSLGTFTEKYGMPRTYGVNVRREF